jgi:transcriptional regulator with XRE-family HTH domain
MSKRSKVSISKVVLAEINKRGITQRDLAEAAKVDRTVLGRWLNGRRGYTVANCEKILGVLGLRVVSPSDD